MIESDSKPFGDGPLRHLDLLLDSRRADRARTTRRALVADVISCAPLVLLAAWQGLAFGGRSGESLLLDFVAIARYGVSVPLLILAEAAYVPRLCRIHRHFVDGGFVATSDQPQFDRVTATTERVIASVWMEGLLVAAAVGLTWGVQEGHYVSSHSTWAAPIVDGQQQRSLAGWWRVLVSHPLFLVLVLRTFVRLCAWTGMLWRLATLNLRLIPSHADRMGGLRFVTTSVYGFLPLAFTFGVLMAGRVAEAVIVDGRSPWDLRYYPIATAIIAIVAFAGPLLVFQNHLWRLKSNGLFGYGALATRVGRRFEARWLSKGPEMTEDVLEAQDFSATTDLFSIVWNVCESRLFMLDSSVVVPLLVTVMLPFVPLLFVIVPLDEILAFVERSVL